MTAPLIDMVQAAIETEFHSVVRSPLPEIRTLFVTADGAHFSIECDPIPSTPMVIVTSDPVRHVPETSELNRVLDALNAQLPGVTFGACPDPSREGAINIRVRTCVLGDFLTADTALATLDACIAAVQLPLSSELLATLGGSPALPELLEEMQRMLGNAQQGDA